MIEDSDLIFNKVNKRYYLTVDYVYNKLGTDLSTILFDEFDTNLSTIQERTIEYACDMLYDFIEENAVNRISTLYDFTQREDAHEALKRALGYQLLYFIQVGDTSNEVDTKIGNSVSNRAIQLLLANDCFHVIRRVPEDIGEW